MAHNKRTNVRDFARNATRVAVVRVLNAQLEHDSQQPKGSSPPGAPTPSARGHYAVTTTVVETLTNICERFIRDMGRLTHAQSELAGRTQSNLSDVISTLRMVYPTTSSSLRELAMYEHYEEIPFPRKLVPFPASGQKRKLQDKSADPSTSRGPPPGSEPTDTDGTKLLGPHVEEWMPPLPSPHTYVSTPISSEPEVAKSNRVLMAQTRRQVENSLIILRSKQELGHSSTSRLEDSPFLKQPLLVDATGKPIDANDAEDGAAREVLESDYVTEEQEKSNGGKGDDQKDRKKARVERILAESEHVHRGM